MPLLVRKIKPAIWADFGDMEGDGVPATVVQDKDFHARQNELSFWRCDPNSPTWEEDVILAIVGGTKRADGVFFVQVDEDQLQEGGVQVVPSTGQTCFEEFSNRHVDAVKLNAQRLAHAADVVARAARKKIFSWTRRQVVEALRRAVGERQLVKVDNLPSELKKAVLEVGEET